MPTNDTTPGMIVKIAEADAALAAVHRINRRVYAEELGQDPTRADGRLVDRFHGDNTYIIALVDDEVVGMMALTMPGRRFSLEDAPIDRALIDAKRASAAEMRRLAVLPEHRGSGCFLRILDFCCGYLVRRGIRHAFISAIAERAPMYARLGFRQFDAPFRKGPCLYYPMVLSVESMAAAHLDPRLFPTVADTLQAIGL